MKDLLKNPTQLTKIKMKLLFLLFLCPVCFFPESSFSQESFRILSYNTYEGFQDSSALKQQFISLVDNLNPDVVAFQELNSFTEEILSDFARTYNHPYSAILADKGYYVGLTAKKPIRDIQRVRDGFKLGYIYGKVGEYHFFVLHLDPHSFKDRKRELNIILTHASKLPKGEPVLLMGDFNGLSTVDSAIYSQDNRIDYAKKFRYGLDDGISNFDNGKFDYSVISTIRESGLFDTYELVGKSFTPSTNPIVNKVLKADIRLSPSGGGPCRIDYIWVNKPLKKKVKRFEIINNAITKELSDHFPLYLELY